MRKKRELKLFFADIIEAIRRIKSYTLDMTYDTFEKNDLVVDAVVRNFEIIGEAAKNIPLEMKKKHTSINWKAIAGMRDKLIHEYFGVSKKIVWATISDDLPDLELQIKEVLRNL